MNGFRTMRSLLILVLVGATTAAAPLSGVPGAPNTDPPPAWQQGDPGDSLYRSARTALSRNDYRRAAQLFQRLRAEFPRSAYAADSHYWEAFALYRIGGAADLERAARELENQRRTYPQARTRRDADALATRIRGELARRGDAGAAERVARDAARPARAPRAPTAPGAPTPPRPPGAPTAQGGEEDVRVAALNALLQMDAEQAMPILRQVLARRDAGSASLRRKAVFLVSQKSTAETENLLLSVARNDPDPGVREQAVFWLSQVPTDRAVNVLGDILRTSTDAKLRERAIFALSQQRSPRAHQLLRSYAEAGSSAELQEKAIFWIGQQASPDNAAFLRGLYPRLQSQRLKERTLFALSQMSGQGNDRWLMEIATNTREPMEMRKKALFWAGQGSAPIGELVNLYNRMPDREMREQLIFVYSQRRDRAATDKLIDIARREQDQALRKKALFWLGQSNDPRAAQALLEVINQ
jgi:TolA-binding protein